MANQRLALFGAHERPVVDDHGKRRIDLQGYRHREVVAAAGYQSDFDATAGGFGDGGTGALGDGEAAAEERAVNIERDEFDRHHSILADSAAGTRENACVRILECPPIGCITTILICRTLR